MLAAANPQEQKQMLGERLFPLIQVFNVQHGSIFNTWFSRWLLLILLAKSRACCWRLTIRSCCTCSTIESCWSLRSTKPCWSCSIINRTQAEQETTKWLDRNDRQAKVSSCQGLIWLRNTFRFSINGIFKHCTFNLITQIRNYYYNTNTHTFTP